MLNEVSQLVQAYHNLSSNNNELIDLATLDISNLINNPSIINSLFQIIENSDESYIRNQAAISLKSVVSNFKDNYSIEEIQNIFDLVLKCLLKESFESIQNIFFDIIYTLLSEPTIPILFSFIQNSDLDSINARLLLSFADDRIQPFLPLANILIDKLFNSDINAILLGFRIRSYIDPNFFLQIFHKGVEMSISLSNDTKSLSSLMKSISQALFFIDDKLFILNSYLPLIGVEDSLIPWQNQLLYSNAISESVKSIHLNDVQMMFLILQKYFQLYNLIDENDDIFDFIESFVVNPEFLTLFISKIDELSSSSEKNFIATLFCLSHCFSANMNVYTNFAYVHEVAKFLSQSVLNPSKKIRTAAGNAIQNFSIELEENISEVCPLLVNSMIDSLNSENNDEIIEALSTIFAHSSSDEESVQTFFDKAFTFFLFKIHNHDNLQHIYPSFVALCATSRKKSYEHFQEIFEINNSVISLTNPAFMSIQEFGIEGIKNLAIICSENFSDKISDLIIYFIQILNQNIDDCDLIISILTAIGSFISRFANDFDFSSLIPILVKLVQNNDDASPLALSTICAIMNEYVNKVDLTSMIPNIVNYFLFLSNDIHFDDESIIIEKPILDLLRAMTIFVEYISSLSIIGKTDEERKKAKTDLYDSILSWTFNILKQTDNNYIISEAFSILTEIVDDYSFNPSFLFPIFKQIFEKEYDDDLFPTFSFFLRKLIQKGVIFDSFIPNFFEMTKPSNKNEIRDFGLQILGQIAENKSGDCINENFIKNLVEASLKSIHDYESSPAVFVLNQLVTGCSNVPNFNENFMPTEMMKVLLECLKMDKKNASYLEFADNCVTSFASIVINIVKDIVPFESYLQIILERMPARFDTAENSEMMEFLLWIGDQNDFNPPELFLAVLVRLFSHPIDKDIIGFIAGNNELIETLKSKLKLLMGRVDNLDSFVIQICNNDQYKLHYFYQNLIDE